MPLPDLNLLVALDVLLTEGSVVKAASRLGLSASAMSRTLARLRAVTADPLLVRAGRGLVPTPRALELRSQVGRIVQDAASAFQPNTPFDPASLTRIFTLRVNEGFAEAFAPALVARIASEAPGVVLRFAPKPDKDVAVLREAAIDLEIGVAGEAGPELRVQALFHDRFIGVVHPDHDLATGAITPARYAEGGHVSVSRRGRLHGPIDTALSALGLVRRVVTIVAGFSAALELARLSGLVASVPERQTATRRAGLHSFPLPVDTPPVTGSQLWHPRMDSDPAHRWLRSCVRDVLRLALVSWLGLSAAQAASLPAVEAAGGMVVTEQRQASEVGADILRQGGNAIDAAVAIGYALAVVDPCCGNIGGGGFMMLHLADGRDRFLNFRETAPAAATATMFLDPAGQPVPGASLKGSRAAGIPGTVLGLETARAEYGSMPRAALMAPAIRLAQDGFVLTRADTDILDYGAARFRRQPSAARIFLRPDGTNLQPGDRLVQPDLAATLQRIAADGANGFYHGPIPQAVAALAQQDGGLLTEADFAAYTVTETDPIRCTYRGATILAPPPPSSGGTTLCEILDVLQGYDMHALGWHSAQSVHLMVEAMRHAFLDRNTLLGDPAFVANPIDTLLSPDHAARIRAAITDRAGVSEGLSHDPERPQTTQFTIVDHAGNAAAVTYTINGGFGAATIAGRTGFLLNNEMDDFTTKPGTGNMYGLVQGEANAIAPGKRPLSSMTPLLVMRDGRLLLAGGSPGGSRIITIMLQVIMNVLDYGMSLQEAVDAGRIHHQWLPDTVYAEPFALSPDTQQILRTMGYTLREQRHWGAAEMIQIGPATPPNAPIAMPPSDAALSGATQPGLLYGANDSRRPAGAAIGP